MNREQPKNESLVCFASIIVAMLALLIAYRVYTNDEKPAPNAQQQSDSSITIAIDSGDGQPLREVFIDIRDGMTVIDAMRRAKAAGSIEFAAQGRGEGSFVTQINGVANGGADGRNWLFDINGAEAQVGAGAIELKGGDRVLWRFGAYE